MRYVADTSSCGDFGKAIEFMDELDREGLYALPISGGLSIDLEKKDIPRAEAIAKKHGFVFHTGLTKVEIEALAEENARLAAHARKRIQNLKVMSRTLVVAGAIVGLSVLLCAISTKETTLERAIVVSAVGFGIILVTIMGTKGIANNEIRKLNKAC